MADGSIFIPRNVPGADAAVKAFKAFKLEAGAAGLPIKILRSVPQGAKTALVPTVEGFAAAA